MPRLAGKRSPTGLSLTLVVVALLIAFLLLEYFSVINLIPNFGI